MANKKLLRTISILLFTALAAALFAGCGSSSQKNPPGPASTAAPSTQQTSREIYPLAGNVALKYWVDMNPNVSPNFKNLGDTPFAQELQKKTGVKVEFIHPAQGQAAQAFSIMVASGDLPDLISWDWVKFPGGPEQAIANDVIIKLNEPLDKYSPNLKKFLAVQPDIDKAVKTDNGSYYVFPCIPNDKGELVTTYGPVVRSDWLKDLGLQPPETMDEWYAVLKAFKEKKNAASPFSYTGANGNFRPFANGMFIGAYGTTLTFYQVNGKVKYGPYEPGYKNFLATMAKWYKEGLIDKNFASTDGKTLDANILNGQTGAAPMWPGSDLGKYIPTLRQKDPNAGMAAVPMPVLKKGERPQFSSGINPYYPNVSVAVSKNCKNVETAVRFMDYNYGDEGGVLFNFGIEGKSYTLENGKPKLTNEILNNPDKLPLGQAWAKYAMPYSGPFIQNPLFFDLYYVLPEQRDALKLWLENDWSKYILPPITPTQEESTQYAKIMTDVNTYMQEYLLKVIMGSDSIDNFDKYTAQLKKLGVENAIAIQQAALDRYKKR